MEVGDIRGLKEGRRNNVNNPQLTIDPSQLGEEKYQIPIPQYKSDE